MPNLTVSGSPTFNSDGSCTIDATGPDRVQGPASALDETQGWFACRVNARSSAAAMAADARVFSFEDADTAMVTLYWSGSAKQFGMARQNGGTFGQVVSAVQSFAAGDDLTLIGAWTGTTLLVSINGGAFVSAGMSSIPTIVATLFDIARRSTSAVQYFDVDYFWAAAGLGTLSNADAAAIHAWGNTDPTFALLPGSPSFLWRALDTTYSDSPGSPPFVDVTIVL